jgi:hypothetical protein
MSTDAAGGPTDGKKNGTVPADPPSSGGGADGAACGGPSDPEPAWATRGAGWALLAALVLSAGLLAHQIRESKTLARDGVIFVRIARHFDDVLRQRGVEDAMQVLRVWDQHPLYPLATWAVYRGVGERLWPDEAVRWERSGRTAAAAGQLLLVLAAFLAARRLFDPWAGAAAALGVAVLPQFVFTGADVMSDCPALAFMTLSLLFAARALRSDAILDFLLCGVFGGLAWLTRPECILVAGLLGVWLAIRLVTGLGGDRRTALVGGLVLAHAAAAYAMPLIVLRGRIDTKPKRGIDKVLMRGSASAGPKETPPESRVAESPVPRAAGDGLADASGSYGQRAAALGLASYAPPAPVPVSVDPPAPPPTAAVELTGPDTPMKSGFDPESDFYPPAERIAQIPWEQRFRRGGYEFFSTLAHNLRYAFLPFALLGMIACVRGWLAEPGRLLAVVSFAVLFDLLVPGYLPGAAVWAAKLGREGFEPAGLYTKYGYMAARHMMAATVLSLLFVGPGIAAAARLAQPVLSAAHDLMGGVYARTGPAALVRLHAALPPRAWVSCGVVLTVCTVVGAVGSLKPMHAERSAYRTAAVWLANSWAVNPQLKPPEKFLILDPLVTTAYYAGMDENNLALGLLLYGVPLDDIRVKELAEFGDANDHPVAYWVLEDSYLRKPEIRGRPMPDKVVSKLKDGREIIHRIGEIVSFETGATGKDSRPGDRVRIYAVDPPMNLSALQLLGQMK